MNEWLTDLYILIEDMIVSSLIQLNSAVELGETEKKNP